LRHARHRGELSLELVAEGRLARRAALGARGRRQSAAVMRLLVRRRAGARLAAAAAAAPAGRRRPRASDLQIELSGLRLLLLLMLLLLRLLLLRVGPRAPLLLL
jgi:hypothetical protein